MADQIAKGDETFKGIAERLLVALDSITAPYVPSPEEAMHLEAALVHLIAAFGSRDFEPGEEAVWNCHRITFGGKDAGAWEIKLRQTDACCGGGPQWGHAFDCPKCPD